MTDTQSADDRVASPLDKLINHVLTGGNHLASALLNRNVHPFIYNNYDEVLAKHDGEIADMWIAWHCIMKLAEYTRTHPPACAPVPDVDAVAKTLLLTISSWLDDMGVSIGGKHNEEATARWFLALNVAKAAISAMPRATTAAPDVTIVAEAIRECCKDGHIDFFEAARAVISHMPKAPQVDVAEVLKRAKQTVAPAIAKGREGECITADVMGFRMGSMPRAAQGDVAREIAGIREALEFACTQPRSAKAIVALIHLSTLEAALGGKVGV